MKLLSRKIKASATNVLVFWNFILVTAMFFGISGAHIGSITWSPGRDFWAMSIAISKLKYGLEGGLGYRTVSNELAKYLTPNGEDLDASQQTKELVDKPALIEKAIQAAIAIPPSTLKPGPIDSGMYITSAYDDFGYPEFIEYAFRLFGFHALSTHYLYFLILSASLLIFVLTFYKYELGIILLTATLTALFLVSSCPAVFNTFMPNFAASRFLGSLAILPLLHLLIYIFRSGISTKKDIFFLVIQAILFAFTVRLRSSASWMIIALFLTVFSIFFYHLPYRFVHIRKSFFSLMQVPEFSRSIKVLLLVVIALTSFNMMEKLSLNKIYFSEELGTSHVFWHNGYMGLTFHPHWKEQAPYPELLNQTGDMVPFTLYEIYFKDLPPSSRYSSVTKLQKIRVYEKIVRNEYLTFAFKHPKYMFEMIFYYKPYCILTNLHAVFLSVPIKAWLVSLVSVFGALILLRTGITRKEQFTAIKIALLIFAVSITPEIWAYPASFLIADPFWMLLVIVLMITNLLLSYLLHRIYILKMRFYDVHLQEGQT